MGSQLISNVVRSFFLAMVLTGLLTGSVAEAASYQKKDGTIVDPILDRLGLTDSYSGPNLEPDANLRLADLGYADLTGADLTGAYLTGAYLRYTDLTDADLTNADLYSANLTGAKLWDANLTDADLSKANLQIADLNYANLTNVNLTNAWMPQANLSDANLTNADLSDADLSKANLTNADLSDADLSDADLRYADLLFANLVGADLTGACLHGVTSGGIVGSPIALPTNWQLTQGYLIGPGANLLDANLKGANLTNANLTDADLTFANLVGADLLFAKLWGANLTRANLTNADLYSADLTGARNVESTRGSPYYYGNTVLPAGFDAVAQGWTLAHYCDFTPDASCDLADINQMFQVGNLVTGVAISGDTDRLDLIDNDTIDAADITEWLAQAATANGHGSPYLRGDTEFDRDVDITDFNVLASHFDPTGDGDPVNGPFWNEGNFNGDDNVDITDFNLLAANFAPDGYNSSAIPEPSTMLLVLLALILMGVSFRLSKNG